jgi:DNA-binding response OmpR family regulator
MDGYITKPFDPEELLTMVADLLIERDKRLPCK